MSSKFISIMDRIGADVHIAWDDVVKYLPEASALAALLFPGQVGTIAGVVNSVGLIQQAVATVEQKWAALGAAKGTGVQKAAQVTSIVGPTVTSLLAKEGVDLNTTQLNGIINATVAVLNVRTAPAA